MKWDWTEGFDLTAGPRTMGRSEASPEARGYFEGLARRELVVKRCDDCAEHLHPRRIVCPQCGSGDLSWIRVSGRGTVYSFSEIYRAPRAEMEASVPYAVGIVQTEEDVYLFTRFFVAPGAALAIDAPATLEFRELEDGEAMPVWVVGY